jgi:hypothetical protein
LRFSDLDAFQRVIDQMLAPFTLRGEPDPLRGFWPNRDTRISVIPPALLWLSVRIRTPPTSKITAFIINCSTLYR